MNREGRNSYVFIGVGACCFCICLSIILALVIAIFVRQNNLINSTTGAGGLSTQPPLNILQNGAGQRQFVVPHNKRFAEEQPQAAFEVKALEEVLVDSAKDQKMPELVEPKAKRNAPLMNSGAPSLAERAAALKKQE